jgi:signal transduction histidine kinase
VRPSQPLVALVFVAGAVTAATSGVLVARSQVLADPGVNGAYRAVAITSWIGVGLLTWRLRPQTRYGLLLVLAGFAFAATSLLAVDDPEWFTLGRVAWVVFAVVLTYVLLTFPHGHLPRGAASVVFRAFVAATATLWTILLLGAPDLPRGSILTRCVAECPRNPFQVASLSDALATVAEQGATYLLSAMLVGVAVLLGRRARTLDRLERATLALPLGALVVFALAVSASAALRSASGAERGAPLVLGWIGVLAALAVPYALMLGQARGRLFARAALLEAENAALEAELRASAVELRASRARIFAAGAQERRRIERDLHDSAQNRLVALRVKLRLAADGASDGLSRGELSETLAALGEETQDALDAVRAIAQGIYPPALATRGLGEALETEADGAALPVSIVGGDALPRSSPDAESALYFCCLEAIQNACKHAGPGARVTVRLDCADGAIAFSVEDDGAGFAVGSSNGDGSGLTNMRDRVAAVGGEVAVVSARGRGTVVSGSAPWPARPAGAAY